MKKVVLLLMLFLLLSLINQDVYGHGLGREDVGPKNIGDRLISMSIEISPEIKRVYEFTDITLRIEFKDAVEKKTIPGVAARIEISRFRDNQLLLNETFHVMSDVEKLEVLFKTTMSGPINIEGMKMGSFGYMRKTGNDMVIVEGPIFTRAGLYKFKVTPIALDSESLPEDQRIPFESLITLAEIKSWNIDNHNIETIAYYDSITKLDYDPNNLIMKAEMPFDWKFVDEISMLHFEYYLPKGFKLADEELIGYINGIEQPIFVDRASEGWGAIVHFMIGQNRLKELVNQIENKDVAILEIRSSISKEVKEWSEPITISGNNIDLDISWYPKDLNIDDKSVFKLVFKDKNGNHLTNVKYDIMIRDTEGNIIQDTLRSDQVSETQEYKFDKTGAYTLMINNINGSDERAAINISVVPEFPIAILIISIAMITVLLFNRTLRPI